MWDPGNKLETALKNKGSSTALFMICVRKACNVRKSSNETQPIHCPTQSYIGWEKKARWPQTQPVKERRVM